MERYLSRALEKFAQEKFVFLSGPRQVGKTTLAKGWLSSRNGTYLNWDFAEDKKRILNFPRQLSLKEGSSRVDFFETGSMVFDEVHKYPRWKSYIKGLYDKVGDHLQVVVTGSARLDIYQRGGDSLLGRYELLRLHPLSIGELTTGRLSPPPESSEEWLSLGHGSVSRQIWRQLADRGGFPEPFHRDDPAHYRRWSNRRRELLVQQDLRDLTEIKTLSLVENLAILLPDRVGSPLSLNSLREELGVAHDTVRNWLEGLERLYYCHRISPYSKKIARSLKKEQKLYLWDWAQIREPGHRFENMVAGHLVKAVDCWNDLGLGHFSLHYWRDLEKREVDFILTNDGVPVVALECKLSDASPSPSLLQLSQHLKAIPLIQIVEKPGVDSRKGSLRVVSADRFLAALP